MRMKGSGPTPSPQARPATGQGQQGEIGEGEAQPHHQHDQAGGEQEHGGEVLTDRSEHVRTVLVANPQIYILLIVATYLGYHSRDLVSDINILEDDCWIINEKQHPTQYLKCEGDGNENGKQKCPRRDERPF